MYFLHNSAGTLLLRVYVILNSWDCYENVWLLKSMCLENLFNLHSAWFLDGNYRLVYIICALYLEFDAVS